jgi:hypothetical protein
MISPMSCRTKDRLYFPIFQFYPEKEFGGKYLTEADYVSLRESSDFKDGKNWMILPPIPHNPLHSYIDLPGTPPHPPSARHLAGYGLICTGCFCPPPLWFPDLYAFFTDSGGNLYSLWNFDWGCAGIFWRSGRYGYAKIDRDLVLPPFSLCGHT